MLFFLFISFGLFVMWVTVHRRSFTLSLQLKLARTTTDIIIYILCIDLSGQLI